MATPDFIKFSRLSGTPADAYRRLADDFFAPLKAERHSFVHLRRTDDPFYAGLEQVGDPVLCEDIDQIVESSVNHSLFGSMHLLPEVPGYIYFHTFDVDDTGFSMTSSIDTGLVAWDFRHWDRGHPDRWFKVMLTRLTAALRAEVSGWGRDNYYSLKYESLSSETQVARLRSGEMLESGAFPIYHAFSLSLIEEQEVQELLRKHKVLAKPRGMEYEVTVSGYHLLYILP